MLYPVAKILVSSGAKLLFRLRIIGEENIPRNGGLILAANHVSYWDIPLMACGIDRQVDFMGKEGLFRVPVIGTVFKEMGGFPVRRGEGDRKSIQEAVRRLREGRTVGIFPEGTRSTSGRLQEGKPGVGMLVALSGVPVVPVLIEGTWKWWRFGQVTVRYGRPMDFSAQFQEENPEKKRVAYERISREIMAAIAKLGDTSAPAS